MSYEVEKTGDYPSASGLSKLGITAIGYTAGGIFLFLLQFIARGWFGIVVGAIVCLFGISSFLSKDPADKKAGAIIMTAGILTVVSRACIPLLAGISGTLLGIGAFGLFAMGIIKGIKFFFGLKKRS